MKLSGVLFLCIGLNNNAMNQPIQNEEYLKKVYENIATQHWQPTTIAYMEHHPSKPESLILKRYTQMFASRAMRERNPSLNILLVGAEVHFARNFTPSSKKEYKYITKGKPYTTAYMLVCTYKWHKKLKKIEEEIKKTGKR